MSVITRRWLDLVLLLIFVASICAVYSLMKSLSLGHGFAA